jgi:hypothetical protein
MIRSAGPDRLRLLAPLPDRAETSDEIQGQQPQPAPGQEKKRYLHGSAPIRVLRSRNLPQNIASRRLEQPGDAFLFPYRLWRGLRSGRRSGNQVRPVRNGCRRPWSVADGRQDGRHPSGRRSGAAVVPGGVELSECKGIQQNRRTFLHQSRSQSIFFNDYRDIIHGLSLA